MIIYQETKILAFLESTVWVEMDVMGKGSFIMGARRGILQQDFCDVRISFASSRISFVSVEAVPVPVRRC